MRYWTNSRIEALLQQDDYTPPTIPYTRGRVLADPEGFQVQPEDIPTGIHFFGAFGNFETEISARWLIQFCQKRGQAWAPFTRADIDAFYRAAGYERFEFNWLIEPGRSFGIRTGYRPSGGGWIVDIGNVLHFTDEFIMRCYAATHRPGVTA